MTTVGGLSSPSEKTDVKTSTWSSQLTRAFLIICVIVFTAVQLRRAWVSDDAFITFRTVDNFLHGYGLVWNISERVQTYTHPLWMLVLSAAGSITHELVFTSMILSILISLAVVVLFITRIAISPLSALFAVVVLILSNAFVDYSTSGLENPLSHLLLVIFFVIFFNQKNSFKKIFWLSFVASLGALNRLDLMLIFAPPLFYSVYEARQIKGIVYLLAGQLPLILWEIFSLTYYGFLFPNTAYAKLNTGIPSTDLAIQGLLYLRDSLQADPITLVIIASGIILAFISKEKKNIWIATGVILYLLYTVKIGGDFMSGRFLAAPVLCSLVIISRFNLSSLPALQVSFLFSATLILGLLSPTPTLNFRETYLTPKQRSAMVNNAKISNERRYYNWSNGIWRIDPNVDIPDHPYALDGLQARENGAGVVRRITVGMFAYYAGPKVFVLDELALGDPLLARLPAKRVTRWRIGHFQRTIPDGYLETLQSGENRLADANLAKFYDQLNLITRGDLFLPERLTAILKMNTRQYNSLIDFDTYRYPKQVRATLDQVNIPKAEGTAWDAPGNIIFQDSGIEVEMIGAPKTSQLELSLAGANNYQIQFMKSDQVISQVNLSLTGKGKGLRIACIQIPDKANQEGYDFLRIFPTQGDANTSLGYLSQGYCSTY